MQYVEIGFWDAFVIAAGCACGWLLMQWLVNIIAGIGERLYKKP